MNLVPLLLFFHGCLVSEQFTFRGLRRSAFAGTSATPPAGSWAVLDNAQLAQVNQDESSVVKFELTTLPAAILSNWPRGSTLFCKSPPWPNGMTSAQGPLDITWAIPAIPLAQAMNVKTITRRSCHEKSLVGIPNSPQNRTRQSSGLLSPSMFTDGTQATCGGQQRTEHSICHESWLISVIADPFRTKWRGYLLLCSPCHANVWSILIRCSCVEMTESLSPFSAGRSVLLASWWISSRKCYIPDVMDFGQSLNLACPEIPSQLKCKNTKQSKNNRIS